GAPPGRGAARRRPPGAGRGRRQRHRHRHRDRRRRALRLRGADRAARAAVVVQRPRGHLLPAHRRSGAVRRAHPHHPGDPPTPRRGRVVIAKLLAYALAAVPIALLVLAVDVLVVEIYAGARSAAPSLDADNLRTLGSTGVVLVVYAVIGVGIGALLRNQVGA